MADKARHAFGSELNVDAALQAGKIDAYDILFLDEKKIGWIDKNGNKIIIEDKAQIVRVTELPTADGDEGVVYIFENKGYVWDGAQCVAIAEGVDLSALEGKVSDLEAEIEAKVDTETVQAMIEEHYESMIKVVEF